MVGLKDNYYFLFVDDIPPLRLAIAMIVDRVTFEIFGILLILNCNNLNIIMYKKELKDKLLILMSAIFFKTLRRMFQNLNI